MRGGLGSTNSGGTSPSGDNNSRATTPPVLKTGGKIIISKPEIEMSVGEKPKYVSMNELEEEKNKGQLGGSKKNNNAQDKLYKNVNSIDTLYSLFLNHLLRPREW